MNSKNDLRQRAIEQLKKNCADISSLPRDNIQDMIYELQVHQIELQMQNEALKEAQIELAESHDRYVDLYEFAPTGYLSLDHHFHIKEVNLKAVTMIGVERQALLKVNFLKFIEGDYRDACYKIFRSVLNSAADTSTECLLKRSNGRQCYVHIDISRYDSVPLNKYDLRLTMSDITERIRIQEALHLSEKMYKEIVENANEGIWQLDKEANVLYANSCMSSLLGVSPGQLVNRNVLEFVIEEDMEEARNEWTKRLHSDQVYKFEFRFRQTNGMIIWVAITSSIIWDKRGNLNSIVAIITNISDQKKERLNLQEAKKHLEKRVEKQNQKISNTQFHLAKEINERLLAEKALSSRQQALESIYAIVTAFGLSLEAIHERIARSISNILNVQLVVVVQFKNNRVDFQTELYKGNISFEKFAIEPCSACKPILKRGCSSQILGNLCKQFPESICFQKDIFHSYIGVPILDISAESVGSICVMRMEEKKFEEYEIHFIEIFARYIAYEISRRKMEKMVLQSNEIKLLSQLTSGVAHEVRNPLNALTALNAALFKRIGDTRKYQGYVTRIKDQIQRLAYLMEDLLSLGRPINIKNFELTTIADLISEAVKMWTQSKPNREHRIEIVGLSSLGGILVNVDETKIQQVFINLLDNSENHTSEQEIITIKICKHEDPFLIQILFCDRGTGISPADLPYVFEPFFTKRKSGNGLGLSIVKNIVDHHGGKVELFNNEPYPGLTVRIILPLVPMD